MKKSLTNSAMISWVSLMKTSFLKQEPLNARSFSSRWKVIITGTLGNIPKVKETRKLLKKLFKHIMMPLNLQKKISKPPTQSDLVSLLTFLYFIMKSWMSQAKHVKWLNKHSMMLWQTSKIFVKINIKIQPKLCNLLEITWLFGLQN